MSRKKEKLVGRFEVLFHESSWISEELNATLGWTEGSAGTFQIIRDNETGVLYLRNYDTGGGISPTMIPLLDCEGKIIVDKTNPEYQKANITPYISKERVKDHSVTRRG